MPLLNRTQTRGGSRACWTAEVLANPVPEGGTSPFLASRPEKLQAVRHPSPVPKSAGARWGALGVSGYKVLWAVGSLDEIGLSCDYFWVPWLLRDNSWPRPPELLPSPASWSLAVRDRE